MLKRKTGEDCEDGLQQRPVAGPQGHGRAEILDGATALACVLDLKGGMMTLPPATTRTVPNRCETEQSFDTKCW